MELVTQPSLEVVDDGSLATKQRIIELEVSFESTGSVSTGVQGDGDVDPVISVDVDRDVDLGLQLQTRAQVQPSVSTASAVRANAATLCVTFEKTLVFFVHRPTAL